MLPFLGWLDRPEQCQQSAGITVSCIQPERQSFQFQLVSMMVIVHFHSFLWNLQGSVCTPVTGMGAGHCQVFLLR